jgi:hypothetical protein
MKNVAIKWALVAALSNIILGLIFYIMNLPLESKVRYISLLITIVIVIAAAMEFRDKVNGGYTSVGQIVKLSLLIGLIMGSINGVWGIIYPTFIDTGMHETLLLQTEINLENSGMDKGQIKQAMKWTEMMLKPYAVFLMALLGGLVLSFIISLPTGLILKREPVQPIE